MYMHSSLILSQKLSNILVSEKEQRRLKSMLFEGLDSSLSKVTYQPAFTWSKLTIETHV